MNTGVFPAEFYKRLSSIAPAAELHSSTLNAAHASQTQPNLGRSYRRRSGCPGPCCCGGFREPSAVPLPRCPLFIRLRLVRSRSIPLPTRSRHRLASAPATQIPPRTNGGLLAPPPPRRSIYKGARQVPEL